MLTLLLVGVVAGLITAVSPCVLPVLPAVLTSAVPTASAIPVAVGVGGVRLGAATSATSAPPAAPSRSRPLLVVAGLVSSFAVFTLVGGSLLGALHLRQDVLQWTGIVVLIAAGIGLLVPAVGHLLERPFQLGKLPRLNQGGSGFVTGVALGLVFVPCAGPILTAITVLAASNHLSWRLAALTLAFSVGIAIPLFAFALAGQSIFARVKAVRERLGLFRRISGAILILTGVLIAAHVFDPLQRLVPPLLGDAQAAIEGSSTVHDQIAALSATSPSGTSPSATSPSATSPSGGAIGTPLTFDACANDPGTLHNCGPERAITGIDTWLNTADYTGTDGAPLTAADVKGKVVLIDFWTYSCINCQRTLPFITAWYDKYKADGFVVIGVHTPEFAFEHVASNVSDADARLGVTYPVALDNNYATWNAWNQSYWPAHYLIDKNGIVRQVHYGEGDYAATEKLIQQLLDAPATPMVAASEANLTLGRSPETYVGWARLNALTNTDTRYELPYAYTLTAQPPINSFSLGGKWTLGSEFATTGSDAVLRYHFFAADVFLVLGGEGTVTVTRAGDPAWTKVIHVTGAPTLYTLYSGAPVDDQLTLTFSPDISAYAFTFG
jgi:cytochrome c biogenesis protein CcdA/thiol-disulfide isomerase/thioredoxin